jgi:zona occludens toxin
MAITLYTGLQGSGKSYEVVSSVIVEAVKVGRRVCTNIDGVDSEKIRHYVALKFGLDISMLGHVDHFKNDLVEEVDFFPTYGGESSFVAAGDLVVIDEAWRFWGTGKKSLTHHEIFFREHRHFINPDTFVSCDIVLISQVANDLARFVRGVIEISFRTTKLKSLGLNNNYRIDSYEGASQVERRRSNSWQKKYEKEIFSLYSSYEGGKGVEKQVDKRQNIFRDPKVWLIFAGTVCFIVGGIWGLVFVYKKYTKSDQETDKKTSEISKDKKSSLSAPMADSKPQAKPPQVEYSSEWRIVGTVANSKGAFQVVKNSAGEFRFVPYTDFNLQGFARFGDVDGKRVNYATGNTQQTMSGGMK